MIGLGVGIDYALFIVTRYRSGLRTGLTVGRRGPAAIATAGQAVVFAGSTVVIAIWASLTGLGASPPWGSAVRSWWRGSMLAGGALLPALLGLPGTNIDRLRAVAQAARAPRP